MVSERMTWAGYECSQFKSVARDVTRLVRTPPTFAQWLRGAPAVWEVVEWCEVSISATLSPQAREVGK